MSSELTNDYKLLQSFDRDGDFEQEVIRRNSASLAQSGLYSSSIDGSTISINIDPDAGYSCELYVCLLLCRLFVCIVCVYMYVQLLIY